MSSATKPSWERFGDAMLDWGGYLLLAFATFLGRHARATPDPAWKATTLAIAAVAAAWLYVGYTRRPLPNVDHLVRLDVFFVGLLVLASILMLRQPLFFIFMIAGFFYATILRPLPLAVVGVVATRSSSTRSSPACRRPPRRGRSTSRSSASRRSRSAPARCSARRSPSRARNAAQALARLEAALDENAGLHAQLLTQAREAGVLDERQRMAREIHDTIAQGLTGIITQLEAADQARDRPGRPGPPPRERRAAGPREPDRGAPLGRGLDARRARVGGRCPTRSPSVAREWSELNGDPGRRHGHRRGHRPPPRDRGRAPADRPGGAGERRQARRRRPAPA